MKRKPKHQEPKAPRPEPIVPQGPNMMDIECGKCKARADLDAYKRKGFPENEFLCPACGYLWQIRLEKKCRQVWRDGALIPDFEYDKKEVEVFRPVVIVPPQRLQWGLFGLKEGDIKQTYSADKLPRVKTFMHEGQLFTNLGGGDYSAHCRLLLPDTPENRAAFPYDPDARGFFFYHGRPVTARGQNYLLATEYEFRAEQGIGYLIDMTRRQFAYGGYFASQCRTYENYLRKGLDEERLTPLQRIVCQNELTAGLPQTQAAMKAFLEGRSLQKAA